jgi:hypothetical protein
MRTTAVTAASAVLVFTFALQPPLAWAQQNSTASHATSARQMTDAALAFIATLTSAELDAASFELDDDVRSHWSNVPAYAHPRPGLRLGALGVLQRTRLHDLLRASLSSQGYQKVAGVMRLDDINRDQQVAALRPDSSVYSRGLAQSFGSENYFVAIFGEPRADRAWGWLLQGHHLGASFTVADGRTGFLPLFLGATPLTVDDPAELGWSALSHEVARGFELLHALDERQRAVATSPQAVPNDVLNGVGRKGRFTPPEGLRAAELSPPQQRLLRALVEEYVRNADFDVAEEQLAAIAEAGWQNLSFSWRGSLDPAEPFYYRVQGPRIVIECRNSTNHIHTIVRDPINDYGEEWLGIDYRETVTAAERSAARRAADEATAE